MITVSLDAGSVARVRLAPSPVHDAARWLAWTAARRRHPLWGAPGPAARAALSDPAVAVVARLVRPGLDGGYVPDFLTPKPGLVAARNQLDNQLDRVAATDPEQVRDQLVLAQHDAGAWLDRADRLPGEAASGLSRFWAAVASDLWSRAGRLVGEDVARRSAVLAAGGVGSLLTSLHPTLRWTAGELVVDKPYDERVAYHDQEIVLVPSLIETTRLSVQLCDPDDGVVAFPVSFPTVRDGPLGDALLGRSRTAVLVAAGEGASTLELSEQLGLLPATISHHLKILHGAGLVARTRQGHRVLYARTAAGALLLGGGG